MLLEEVLPDHVPKRKGVYALRIGRENNHELVVVLQDLPREKRDG